MSAYTDEENARRQIKVGDLAWRGLNKKQIADELGCSLDLVRSDCDAMDLFDVPEGVPVRNPRRRPIKHGTDGGWQAHRRRREFPCLPCSLAHAGYLRSRAERAS